MNLGTVRKTDLRWRKRQRVGLGKSAGQGKTAGKGLRGQTVRSGHSLIRYFEGGQMPLTRKLPKRGFNNRRFSYEYAEVNLDTIEKYFKDGEEVNQATLVERGAVAQPREGIRVLGSGALTKKLTVRAHGISKQAESKITKAGGQAIRLERPRANSRFAHVRVSDLEHKFNAGDTVDAASLAKAGLLKDAKKPVKIVFRGLLTKKLTVKANRFSRLAMDKIRAAGGKAIVLEASQ